MTKKEFLRHIAEKTDQSASKIEKTLSAIIEYITKTISKNEKVNILGLGTFSMKKRAARNGRNPKTGEAVKIKAKNIPKFSASKTLKDAINKT